MKLRIKFLASPTIKAVSSVPPPHLKGIVSYRKLGNGRYAIIGRKGGGSH